MSNQARIDESQSSYRGFDQRQASEETLNKNDQRHEKDSDDLEKQKSNDKDEDDEQKEKDPNIVTWDGDNDPENPQNYPSWRKWLITIIFGLNTFSVTFASSVFSSAIQVTAKEFNVPSVVMTLGVSLFVLGFAFGPIVFGPFSELYGRKVPLFFGMFVFAIFQIPVAVAQNLQTIFICRFFGGFFASAPLAVVGGALNDMFDPVHVGAAIAVFASATFIGPVMGPILGGFITMSHLGWRWTAWITLIMALLFAIIGVLVIPETYAGVILQKRAKKLRHKTKNWALRAEIDEQQVTAKDIVQRYLLKPFAMLAMEPILLLITLYMGFIYGFLYLCFEAFPVSYQELRGWNLGVGALPFLALMIGVLAGAIFIIVFTKTRYAKKLEENGEPVPEERLVPMMVGGALLPAGMFWFAWTSNPNITWVPQVLSGGLIGAGVMMIFMQGLVYIIDVYKANSNSALSANAFFRSCLGAGFPIFATGMFHNLGVPWAMSLLGFLTAALFPVPILFYIYGEKIRSFSKYSQ